MTPIAAEKFTVRLRSIYSSQKRRAKKYGQTIPYTADELIAATLPKLAQPCIYCGARLTPKGFQIDHMTPLARGGTFALDNTQPICTPDNRRKHALLHAEFVALTEFLDTCDHYMKQNVLARLSAGGAWLAGKF